MFGMPGKAVVGTVKQKTERKGNRPYVPFLFIS